jgi:hypothetical protein
VAAIRRFLFAAVLGFVLEKAALAKTDLDFVVNSMYQSGKGGKQVYDGTGDQSLTLYEPVLYINSQIDHNTSFFGSVVFDALSSASAKAFDSGTGASGGGGGGGEDGEGGEGGDGLFAGWQTRVGADAGYSKRVGAWAFTPTAGFSHELSYNSLHGGLNVQRFFFEDNFVVSAGGFHYSDEANPWVWGLGAPGKFAGFKKKTTNSLNASVTQLLSENSLVLAGLSYTSQSGFLEGTRNTVSTGTVTQRGMESLPGSRDKWTANARYVRSLAPDLAFHLDYRYYRDSWDIRANTWEPSLVFAYSEEKGLVRLLYRRYSQTAAKYYADRFSGVQKFMTSDSDLQKFSANEYGLQYDYTWEPEDADATVWSLGGTAVYYKRSNDLAALVFQAALKAKF